MLRLSDIIRAELFRQSMRELAQEPRDPKADKDEPPPRAPCPGGARGDTDRERDFDDLEDSAW